MATLVASYCGLGMARSCLMNMASYCAVQACCMASKGACKGVTASSRFAYGVMLLFTSVMSMLLRMDYFSDLLAKIPVMGGLKEFGGVNLSIPSDAMGTIAVLRICLAVAAFHGLMALCLVGVENTKEPRARLQSGAWCLKFVVWAGLLTLAFFVPVDLVGAFQWVAFVGADLFIFIQLVLLIAFAHQLNDGVVERWDEAEGRSKCGWSAVLIVVTFGLYIAAFSGAAFMFSEFQNTEGDCAGNTAAVAVTVMLSLIVTMASVHPNIREAQGGSSGLFQSSILTAYAMYLVASGILSTPLDHCAPFAGSMAGERTAKVAGLFCTFIAVLYSTIRNGSRSVQHASTLREGLLDEPTADVESSADDAAEASLSSADMTWDKASGEKEEKEEKGGEEAAEEGEEGQPTNYSFSFFHVTFCLASMYIAMLLTSWGNVEGVDKELSVNTSMTSVWIKFITAWVCLVLYGWTLLAPTMFPDRDFS